MENIENAGTNVDETANPTTEEATTTESTTTAENVDPVQEEQQAVDEKTTEEKTFTQQQVNDLVRRRLEKENKKIYGRYGVEDKKALDDLVTQAKSYQVMKERYDEVMKENSQVAEENSFLKNNINPEKYEDVRAYFKGKGIDFSNESLIAELETHPEWIKANQTTTVKPMGATYQELPKESEKERVAKMFGLNEFVK